MFMFYIFILIFIVLIFSIKIVNEGQRGIILLLGKYSRTINPGINIVLPYIESLSIIDIREQVFDIPTQEVMTNDSVSCNVDGVVRFKVIDPYTAAFKVQSYLSQISAKAQTSLRDVIGSITLEEVLAKRAEVALKIKEIVDEAAANWGVDILAVEIQNIEIPTDMKRAMAQQAEADRDKKARLIKAEGEKEASLKLAEAAKILTQVKGGLELRTLQTLKEISADPSQKIIIPLPHNIFSFFDHK